MGNVAYCNGRDCDAELVLPEGCKPSYSEWGRTDYNGIYTGTYCPKCYADNYPYRKDDYTEDAVANGECVEPEEGVEVNYYDDDVEY